MSIGMLNLAGKAQLPVVRQQEAAECGFACLVMIANYYGFKTDIATLRRKYAISLQGMTLNSLIHIANKLDFSSRPIQAPLNLLGQLRLPAIIHWDMNHFVVLKSVFRNRYIIHDPSSGERCYTQAEFSTHFTGIALELTPTEKFKKYKEKTRFRLTDLWDRIVGLKHNLLQVFLLSIVLQLFVLISPFYLQIAVDEVLTRFDEDLLFVLATGFAGFTLINFITQALRAYVLLYFGSMLSFQMTGNLFRHLINLPVDYFEKRHIGDIVSRFSSMEPIRELITEGLVAGLLDGFMAVTTLVMMFIYSPGLAAIALSAWLVYLCVRLIFYRPYRLAQELLIVTQARENTTFIETVKGISSLKLAACESERENIWQNKFAEVINSNVKLKKLEIWFQNTNLIVFGIEHIVLIYIAIRMTMLGEFSVGMIFAFMAYKQNFIEKASGLVEKIIDYRLMGLHLERIADIAHSKREERGSELPGYRNNKLKKARLTLQDIHYRYSMDTPEIIRGINMTIDAGDSIAIIGPSGCGKTTLLKLMTGLFKPGKGQVLLDDVPIPVYGLTSYRKLIGVVMQEDDLFTGSIAENIALFDPDIEMQKVISAARTAMIHDDIKHMPMQYESLIGDMGSALSGGQKQRILLARALYRQPDFLFMDEGTAHLDIGTEDKVNESLSSLGITRVVIAHRPETITHARKIYSLGDGVLEDVTRVLTEKVQH